MSDIAGFYNARRDEDRARGAGELPGVRKDAAGVIAEIMQAVAAGELVMAPTDSQRMEELEERVAELERQRQAVLDACDEADMPVKPVRCRNCGPDVIAGEAYCIQCNATSWISAPKALTTAQIRDLLEE